MSITPIPSSSNTPNVHYFPAAAAADDDRRSALHSAWISRLHLKPPPSDSPPPIRPLSLQDSGSRAGKNKLTTSTNVCLVSKLQSSLVTCRGVDFVEGKPRIPPHGFGPFQVGGGGRGELDEKGISSLPLFRRIAQSGEKVTDGQCEKVGICESADVVDRNWNQGEVLWHQNRCNGVKLSPFFQVRPPFECSRGTERMIDKGKSEVSGKQGCESRCVPLPVSNQGSEKTINGFPFRRLYEQQMYANPLPPSSSFRYVSTSRAYFDVTDDSASRTIFRDPQARQRDVTNYQFKRASHANKPEEPFSFWNMGRHKRRDTVCSVLPSVTLTWNQSKKRNADAINIRPWKYRKMGDVE